MTLLDLGCWLLIFGAVNEPQASPQNGRDKVAQHEGKLIDGNLKSDFCCGNWFLVKPRGKKTGRDHRDPIKGSQKPCARADRDVRKMHPVSRCSWGILLSTLWVQLIPGHYSYNHLWFFRAFIHFSASSAAQALHAFRCLIPVYFLVGSRSPNLSVILLGLLRTSWNVARHWGAGSLEMWDRTQTSPERQRFAQAPRTSTQVLLF